MERPEPQAGQASVEVVASVPIVLLAALIVFQLLALGYSSSVADGAAEAGALALAAGKPAGTAARASLPQWARGRADVSQQDGSVHVSLAAPSPLDALGAALTVSSDAWVRGPGEASP
jgi:hypothetical protein